MSYGCPEYDELLDAFKCEFCDKYYKLMSSHVKKIHGMKLSAYKELFGYNKGFALVSRGVREVMKQKYLKNNTSEKRKTIANPAKKGEARCVGPKRAQAGRVKNYQPITVKFDESI